MASNEVYLDRNLTCSTGFPILERSRPDDDPVFGRTINIDLRGHRLRGNGTGTAFAGYEYRYTLNVRDGRMENWASAIVAGRATVTNVQLVGNTAHALGCDDCEATNSVIKNNDIGVFAGDAGSARITNTAITGNRVGVLANGSFTVGDYSDNNFTDNEVAVLHAGFSHRVDAHNNVFTRNGVGISIEDAYGHSNITDNTFTANRDGIYLAYLEADSATAYIARNHAVKNKRYGIYAPGAVDGGGNKATKNGEPCVGVVCTRS